MPQHAGSSRPDEGSSVDPLKNLIVIGGAGSAGQGLAGDRKGEADWPETAKAG